jgi:hypothetical protein
LLNTVESSHEDFDDYKEESLDWSWDNIYKGSDKNE